ncbi:unnamed protein product [Schistocephalus solidus]|uniref:Pectinesterase n=1 Tax=Schistocephalus solidus TaxID=70667 RepID=A0A183SCM2_SCHSO|nr:unnamed protein product [Schistocephalus solidus]
MRQAILTLILPLSLPLDIILHLTTTITIFVSINTIITLIQCAYVNARSRHGIVIKPGGYVCNCRPIIKIITYVATIKIINTTSLYDFSVLPDRRTGAGYQVFTQGSADLVSTLCDNVWDGREISPLTETDRGRILDFYNRNVSTAYCIAFSYTPLLRSLPLLPSRPRVSIHDSACGEELTHVADTKPVKSVVLELPVVSLLAIFNLTKVENRLRIPWRVQ